MDLAVPRDIEPEVAQLDDVYLYTCSTTSAPWCRPPVKSAWPPSARPKPSSKPACKALSTGWTNAYRAPIQALHTQADALRLNEIARARKLLAKGEDIEAVLDTLSRGLTQKMLHGAMAELHSADTQQRPQVAASLARLFLRGDLSSALTPSAKPTSPDEDPASGLAPSLAASLERLALRLRELDVALAAIPVVAADNKRYRELSREHAEVSSVCEYGPAPRATQRGPGQRAPDAGRGQQRPRTGRHGVRRDDPGPSRPGPH